MLSEKLQIISRQLQRKISKISQTHIVRRYSQSSQGLSYFHNVGKEPLVYRNIGQELERAVHKYADIEAIVSCHEGQRHTFRSLFDEVNRLAAGFLKLGLKRGDRVGIWGPNTMHWHMTMMAAARAGLVSVGINPAFQGPEVDYCLKKVGVKAIVAPESFKTQNYYEILKSICPEISDCEPGKTKSQNLPYLRTVIIHGQTKLKGSLSFDNALNLSSADEANKISNMQNDIVPDSYCNVQFTSGTTGHPKAACLSHYNFVNNGLHVGKRNQLEGQRICVQVPLFHAYGVLISIMAAMSYGATLVLPSGSFNPEASLNAIIDEKCTVLHGTPTMYVDLIKKQKKLKLPLKTAKRAITGGAPCSPQLFLDIKNVLGLEEVRTVFGLTESTAVIFQSRSGDSIEQILNTVGFVQDHVEAKVIDAEGRTVPFGQPGELCVRGYPTMLGYYGDSEKTSETIGADKWLRTGDQFVLQEDGYGRIVGRLKEMIIRGGENIFPKEVEDFLNTHPDVIETHIVGVPDERMGEELCAFVRLRDGVRELARDNLIEFSKGKLAHFKVPRYVIPVPDFPKTTSGKIQKFKLQQLFKTANNPNRINVDSKL